MEQIDFRKKEEGGDEVLAPEENKELSTQEKFGLTDEEMEALDKKTSDDFMRGQL